MPSSLTEQLLDFLLFLLFLPFIVLKCLEDLVGGATKNVPRLILQRLLNEGQQNFVRLTSFLGFRAVKIAGKGEEKRSNEMKIRV